MRSQFKVQGMHLVGCVLKHKEMSHSVTVITDFGILGMMGMPGGRVQQLLRTIILYCVI
jgi:hypothetical protein